MTWWLWVLFGFLLLAIEALSAGLHVGFFAAGAMAVGLLVALGVGGPLWLQILLFTLISVAGLLLFRKRLLRALKLDKSPEAIDTLVGETAVALDEIGGGALGKAELRGTSWNARNAGTEPLRRGERCVVERVEGLTIHIRPSH